MHGLPFRFPGSIVMIFFQSIVNITYINACSFSSHLSYAKAYFIENSSRCSMRPALRGGWHRIKVYIRGRDEEGVAQMFSLEFHEFHRHRQLAIDHHSDTYRRQPTVGKILNEFKLIRVLARSITV